MMLSRILLIFFISTLLTAQSKKELLDFSRPVFPGKKMQCSINASLSLTTTTVFAEVNTEPAVTKLVKTIRTKGIIKIIEVNKKGISTVIEYTPETFDGTINGRKIIPSWIGKTIKINMKTKPVCEFTLSDDKFSVSEAEIQLLDLIFKPTPEYTLSDIINPKKPVSVNDTWKPDLEPFRKIFEKQGIESQKPLPLSGNVKLLGKKVFKNFQCWNIQENVSMNDMPGIRFDFFLSTLIPVKAETGPSLKTIRKIYEKIEKKPNADSFMTSGIKNISLEITEALSVISIPLNN
jgi:hypothetical protein